MNSTLKSVAVKYGLILGATSVLSTILLASSRESGVVKFFAMGGLALAWLLKIVLMARAHYEYNKKNNGYISFKDAIIIGLIIIGINEVLSTITVVVNFQFIMKSEFNGIAGASPFIMIGGLIAACFVDTLVLFLLIMFEAQWKIFKKAGKPGWAAFVPIYNTFVMLEIVDKPAWWFLLLCIPLVNIIFAIQVVNLLARRFGKETEFTFGLIFLPFIFYPLLGLSEEEMLPVEGIW